MGCEILMDISELYKMQEELDNCIRIKHKLEDTNLIPSKILALQVELGELANETRCFKFWSNKGPAPKEAVLEEYVDCLHFILSIGLESGLTDINPTENDSTDSLIGRFQNVFAQVIAFQNEPTSNNYEKLFNHFLLLGDRLGFTSDEIYSAYLKKNKINYQRQKQGY